MALHSRVQALVPVGAIGACVAVLGVANFADAMVTPRHTTPAWRAQAKAVGELHRDLTRVVESADGMTRVFWMLTHEGLNFAAWEVFLHEHMRESLVERAQHRDPS